MAPTSDFKRLVAAAHERGVKVILDLVLNHTSSEHPWFKEAAKNPQSPYRDWFLWSKDNPAYSTPWGSPAWHRTPGAKDYFYGIFWEGMPDLNYRNPAVTKEAEDISAFWLKDMGADGFRLDAIKHLIEDGKIQEDTPETHAWLRGYRTFLQSVKPDAFTVGEIFGGSYQLPAYFPDQLDTYFEFGIADGLIKATNDGKAVILTAAVKTSMANLPYQRFAPFLTNHDQERVRDLFLDNEGKAKIAATALLTLPGLPFVYYGEEIGMLGTKPDEKIRTPLAWDGTDKTGGFTTGKPWEPLQAKYPERNIAAESADPNSQLNLYRKLIHLHTGHPALATGDWTALEFERWQGRRVSAPCRRRGYSGGVELWPRGCQRRDPEPGRERAGPGDRHQAHRSLGWRGGRGADGGRRRQHRGLCAAAHAAGPDRLRFSAGALDHKEPMRLYDNLNP